MVQSSIVVPETNKALKRPTEDSGSGELVNEETKRPRLDNADAATKQRNKRLFGTLLGTLSKFKHEVEKTSDIDKKRQAIIEKQQEKLEQQRVELQEKLKARREEKLRLEQEQLEQERQRLEEKKKLSEIIQNERLANFLKTTTEPILYYLPQKLTDSMASTIKEQKEKASEARNQFEEKSNGDNDSEIDDRRHRRHSDDLNNKKEADMPDSLMEETDEDINGDAVRDAVKDALAGAVEPVAEEESKVQERNEASLEEPTTSTSIGNAEGTATAPAEADVTTGPAEEDKKEDSVQPMEQ